jgi:hypothetical protein
MWLYLDFSLDPSSLPQFDRLAVLGISQGLIKVNYSTCPPPCPSSSGTKSFILSTKRRETIDDLDDLILGLRFVSLVWCGSVTTVVVLFLRTAHGFPHGFVDKCFNLCINVPDRLRPKSQPILVSLARKPARPATTQKTLHEACQGLAEPKRDRRSAYP